MDSADIDAPQIGRLAQQGILLNIWTFIVFALFGWGGSMDAGKLVVPIASLCIGMVCLHSSAGGWLEEKFEQSTSDLTEAVEKGIEEVGRFGKKVENTITRARDQTKTHFRDLKDDVEIIDKVIKETERAGRKTEDLVNASGSYIDRSLRAKRDMYEIAFEAARSGNLVDAFYTLSIQDLEEQDDIAARAVMESSYLNTIATTAASVYGGPGGAAAYAAWYTYKQTGDLDLAVKTGVITGATSSAMGNINTMPSSQWEQKALLAGAVGGASIAASGGDSDAVWDGFLKGGGMMLVQDGYKEYITPDEVDPELNPDGYGLHGMHSLGDGYCMGAAIGLNATDKASGCLPPKKAWIYNDEGEVVDVDITKTDLRKPHVGLWSEEMRQSDAFFAAHEEAAPMELVSRVPGMNSMSIAHDKFSGTYFAGDYLVQRIATVASIPPFIVLTYVGLGAPTYGLITEANIQEHKKSNPDLQADQIRNVVASTEENTAKATFVCTQDQLKRTIILDSPSSHPQFACRVIYKSEKGLKVPWDAVNTENYCEPHAKELVAKQLSWGWSCLIQGARERDNSQVISAQVTR